MALFGCEAVCVHALHGSSCGNVFFFFGSPYGVPPFPGQILSGNTHKTHAICLLALGGYRSHLSTGRQSDEVVGLLWVVGSHGSVVSKMIQGTRKWEDE